MTMKDLNGQKFGKLTILYRLRNSIWHCQCDCGNELDMIGHRFTSGKTKSCGCAKAELNFNSRHDGTIPYIGDKWGSLTCVERIDGFGVKYANGKHRNPKYRFLCDCGKSKIITITDVKNGRTKSCGCLAKKTTSELLFQNLSGQRFYYLTVLKRVENKCKGKVYYECLCDCGKTVIVRGECLKSDHNKSCGCLKKSTGEYLVEQYLIKHNIDYRYQYKHDKLKIMPFDFGIFQDDKLLYCIEFNGIQHYKSIWENIKITQERDQRKYQFCKDNNISLLVIHYKDKKNIDSVIDEFLKNPQ